jgi:hypothetical protein
MKALLVLNFNISTFPTEPTTLVHLHSAVAYNSRCRQPSSSLYAKPQTLEHAGFLLKSMATD